MIQEVKLIEVAEGLDKWLSAMYGLTIAVWLIFALLLVQTIIIVSKEVSAFSRLPGE